MGKCLFHACDILLPKTEELEKLLEPRVSNIVNNSG